MCRYTALRTSLILAAVLKPLLTLAMVLCLTADKIDFWLIALGICFMLVSYAPALCLDPATEEMRPRQPRQKIEGWRLVLIWTPAVLLWLLYLPKVQDLVLAGFLLLWDWRAITAMCVLCLLWIHRGLRRALAFKPADLYPNLRRLES